MSEKVNVVLPIEEYIQLQTDSIKLNMLEVGGVDNWNGYGDSLYPEDESSFDDKIEYMIDATHKDHRPSE